jgi:hypothetical protein
MRVVPQAENHPGCCLVTRDHEGPFMDFEAYTTDMDPHVYLSVALVRQAAEELGFISPEAVEQLKLDLRAIEARCDQLERFAQAVEAKEAADQALEEVTA